MKKTLLAALLALTLLPLAACGNSDTPDQAIGAVSAAEAEIVRDVPSETNRPEVDCDLTALSSTMVYSQVFDMMVNPEKYEGQTVKARGSFGYYQDAGTNQEYFAAVIADATACCAQGIEFVLDGDFSFPEDYPPLGTEITVTGNFSYYMEGENIYVQLQQAEMTW